MDGGKYKKVILYTFAGLGALVAMKGVGNVVRLVKYWTKRPVPLQRTYGENTWALITGGSRGIGFEFAKQLGTKGFNIIILDKEHKQTQQAVNKLSEILKGRVKVNYLNSDIIESLNLEQYDISILINNAGIRYFVH